jgi:ClpP class serine protease
MAAKREVIHLEDRLTDEDRAAALAAVSGEEPSELFSPDTMWAILPRTLSLLVRKPNARIKQPDDVAIRAFMTRRGIAPLDGTLRAGIIDGVGVLPVFGAIYWRQQWQALAADFGVLMKHPKVRSIVLDIDSPGGIVTGTQEFADLIYDARGEKEIAAFIAGDGASAAYWVASAAEQVIIAETGEAGSLGVVATYWDMTKMLQDWGIKEIEVVSSQSPLKRLTPASTKGRDLVQVRVDALADVFLSRVAKFRGESLQTVLSEFGAGDMIVGRHAAEAGLADDIGTFEALISSLSTGVFPMSKQATALAPGFYQVAAAGEEPKAVTVDAAFVAQHAAAVLTAAKDEARLEGHTKGHGEGLTAGEQKGVAAERERVTKIQAIAVPGFEKEIAAAIKDGKTAEETATSILAAQKDRGVTLQDLANGGQAVNHGGAPEQTQATASTWDKTVKALGGK